MIPIGKDELDKAVKEISDKLDLILQILTEGGVEEKRGRGRPPKDK